MSLFENFQPTIPEDKGSPEDKGTEKAKKPEEFSSKALFEGIANSIPKNFEGEKTQIEATGILKGSIAKISEVADRILSTNSTLPSSFSN